MKGAIELTSKESNNEAHRGLVVRHSSRTAAIFNSI
jgi:hypothetical protein